MTRRYNVMAACVVVLVITPQLMSCDYKPQPKSFKDYVVRGEFLTRRGRLDEAIENYRKALEIDPESAVVYLRLGQALRRQGKLDQAIESYGQSIVA
jgi:tetratricopeptide (TPR) repeat protein